MKSSPLHTSMDLHIVSIPALHAFLVITALFIGASNAWADFRSGSFSLVLPTLDKSTDSAYVKVRGVGTNNTEVNATAAGVTQASVLIWNNVTSKMQLKKLYLQPGVIQNKVVAVRTVGAIPIICEVDVSSQTYLALPDTWLGTRYTLSWLPPSMSTTYQNVTRILAIGALHANTTVTIRLRHHNVTDNNITLPDTAEHDRTAIQLSLNQDEAVQINSALSGSDDVFGAARIWASNDVTVVAGASMDTSLGETHHVVSQLLPTSLWGRNFVVAPPAIQGALLYLGIEAKRPNTSVTLSGGSQSSRSASSGGSDAETHALVKGKRMWKEVVCNPYCPPVYVQSTSPVSMTSYTLPSNSSYNNKPTVTQVTPTERYHSEYRVTTADLNIQAVFIAKESLNTDGFLVNGKKITKANPAPLTPLNENGAKVKPGILKWTTLGDSAFKICRVLLSNENMVYNFKHSRMAPFGMFIYRMTGNDTVEVPMNMKLVRLWPGDCNETVMVAGDGDDNDCDGNIDEEMMNMMDDDHDGRIDEDVRADITNPGSVSDRNGQVTDETNTVTYAMSTESYGDTMDGNATEIMSTSDQEPIAVVIPITKLKRDFTLTLIISASVLIGLPALILIGLGIDACIETRKDRRTQVWKPLPSPGVAPSETLAMRDTRMPEDGGSLVGAPSGVSESIC